MPHVHPDVLHAGDPATIQAAETLVKALTVPEWPQNQLNPKLPMTRKTLAILERQRAIQEVDRYLTQLAQNGWQTDSRQWHYFRYKYVYLDPICDPLELDERFSAVLGDPAARVYRLGVRFIVYSVRENRWAIVSPDGKRISVYRPFPQELANLGGSLWPILALIA